MQSLLRSMVHVNQVHPVFPFYPDMSLGFWVLLLTLAHLYLQCNTEKKSLDTKYGLVDHLKLHL